MNRQTFHAKNHEVPRDWWVVDATGLVLGRMATQIAHILQGKHKPQYTAHHDVGDFVIILNAGDIKLTGRKAELKTFQTYSGYSGGQKVYSYQWMLDNRPEKLIERAVGRMMPGNRLGRQQLKKLKIYTGDVHEHQAQQPRPLEISA